MNAIGLDLRTLARALDGEISCDEVLCPGPGHSIKDRSLSVRLSVSDSLGVRSAWRVVVRQDDDVAPAKMRVEVR